VTQLSEAESREEVWIVSGRDVYHTNRDCCGVEMAVNARGVSLASLAGFREPCSHCTDSVADPSEYDRSIADPGPVLRAGEVSGGEESVDMGHIWTQDGFSRIRNRRGGRDE